MLTVQRTHTQASIRTVETKTDEYKVRASERGITHRGFSKYKKALKGTQINKVWAQKTTSGLLFSFASV